MTDLHPEEDPLQRAVRLINEDTKERPRSVADEHIAAGLKVAEETFRTMTGFPAPEHQEAWPSYGFAYTWLEYYDEDFAEWVEARKKFLSP